ncbi:MAG TPA: GTP-binding protein [Bauldia sp.]|nr:GTP-binding protein [Bauldia sp.]
MATAMSADDRRIPVFLLTGFLGSGKTTVLKSILSAPDMADTAVVINEFGEIGLDHLIVGALEGETVLLRNGCVCCALRDDLKQTLLDLLGRAARGEVPRFGRIVIETTGLADPVPILETLLSDPMLRHQFRLERTIVTLDAVFGASQLGRHDESVRQVAVADRLLLTKADIAEPADAEAALAAARRINRGARVETAGAPGYDPHALLEVSGRPAEDRLRDTRAWLAAFHHDHPAGHHAHDHDDGHDHAARVRSLSLALDDRLDWNAFGVWLSALLHRHGRRILRVKGILDVNDVDGPVVLQAVEHLMHPPVHLPEWPEGPRGSRLVFITRDLDPEDIRRSLSAYLAAAARLSTEADGHVAA